MLFDLLGEVEKGFDTVEELWPREGPEAGPCPLEYDGKVSDVETGSKSKKTGGEGVNWRGLWAGMGVGVGLAGVTVTIGAPKGAP